MAPKPKEQLHRLGELMSAISEICYYAQWLQGTEHFVPELCKRAAETDRVQPWGHWGVSPNAAKRLQEIAASVGHWADSDEDGIGYVPFNPFPIPDWVRQDLDRGFRLYGSTGRQSLERRVMVAEWIRARRAALKLTQAQVASHLSVAPGKISLWENGRADPAPETVSLLQGILGGEPGQPHDFVLPRML